MSRSVSVNCTSVDPSCYYHSILHCSICILFLHSLHSASPSALNEYDLKNTYCSLAWPRWPAHPVTWCGGTRIPQTLKKEKEKRKGKKKKGHPQATILKNPPPKQRSSWPGSSTFCLRDFQKTPLKNSGNYSGPSYVLSPAADTLHWLYAFFYFFLFFWPLRSGSASATVLSAWGHKRGTGVQIAWQRISQQQTRLQRGVHPQKNYNFFFFSFFFKLSYLTSDLTSCSVSPIITGSREPDAVRSHAWCLRPTRPQYLLSQETSKRKGKGRKKEKKRKLVQDDGIPGLVPSLAAAPAELASATSPAPAVSVDERGTCPSCCCCCSSASGKWHPGGQ